jgi:hypothetical protein
MKQKINAQSVLERVLLVCDNSGFRHEGIFKSIAENRNIMGCLLERSDILDKYPWFGGCTMELEIFYQNLLAAMRPTFPDVGKDPVYNYQSSWPGRDYSRYLLIFDDEEAETEKSCLERILAVCGQEGEYLLERLDSNRKFMETLLTDLAIKQEIGWLEIWIAQNDLFLDDLRRALRQILTPMSKSARQWPGRDYSHVSLLFESRDEVSRNEQDYAAILNKAIAANPNCYTGLLSDRKAFYLDSGGLSRGPEALAFLAVDDPYLGCWYGYVSRFFGKFTAMILRVTRFIDGYYAIGLFHEFYDWVVYRKIYKPCKVQHPDDAFAQSENFDEAVNSLAVMIGRFDIAKRCPDEDSKFYASPLELRTYRVLSTAGNKGV